MKIDNISNQSFKAFEFSNRAVELLQKRYKTVNQRIMHDSMVMEQAHSPVNVKFDTNEKGNALKAFISVSSDKYSFTKEYDENSLEKLLSPLKFITRIYNKAISVRQKLESINYTRKYLNESNRF